MMIAWTLHELKLFVFIGDSFSSDCITKRGPRWAEVIMMISRDDIRLLVRIACFKDLHVEEIHRLRRLHYMDDLRYSTMCR
jgi:hypothetical protein